MRSKWLIKSTVKSRARVCLVWVRPDLLNPVFDVHNFYFNSHFLSLNLQPSTSSLEKHIKDIFLTFFSQENSIQHSFPEWSLGIRCRGWNKNSERIQAGLQTHGLLTTTKTIIGGKVYFSKLISWFLFWEKYVLSWENDKIKL